MFEYPTTEKVIYSAEKVRVQLEINGEILTDSTDNKNENEIIKVK